MKGGKLGIVILGGAAAFAFGISLAVSLWTSGGPEKASGDAGQTQAGDPTAPGMVIVTNDVTQLEGKHLMALIKDLRGRIRDCDSREDQLEEEKKRLRLTRQDLQKEAEQLESLRLQLDAAAAGLRKAKVDLEKERINVKAAEQQNLKRTASVYDTMAAESAAEIFENMCKNRQEEDAAKYLYLMQQRQVGKILAAFTDKTLVVRLNDLMKRIRQEIPAS